MKKLLSILGAAGLVATSSASVVACGPTPTSSDNNDVNPEAKNAFSDTYNLKVATDRTEQENKEGIDQNATVFDLTHDQNGNLDELDIKDTWGVAAIPMYQLIADQMKKFGLDSDAALLTQKNLIERFVHLQHVYYYVKDQVNYDDPDEKMDFLFYQDASVYFYELNDFIGVQHYYGTVRMKITEDFAKALPEEHNAGGFGSGPETIGLACDPVDIAPGTYYFRLAFSHITQ